LEPVETSQLSVAVPPLNSVPDSSSHGSSSSPSHPSILIHDHSHNFGDNITYSKFDNNLRIGFNNIGGFPVLNERNDKVQLIKNFMATYHLDIFGGCESNVNWPLLPDHVRLSNWFRDANQCRSYATHNTHERFGPHQYGGTFWICAGHATQHIGMSDKDPTGLGRGAVCSLQSRSGRCLRILFAYRPCSNSAARIRSVYAQHQRYFYSINRSICPRTAFLDDLHEAIQMWRTAGDSILLFADMNDDIQSEQIVNFAHRCNLNELILSRYPDSPAPGTFQ